MTQEEIRKAAEEYAEGALECNAIKTHEKSWMISVFIYIATWMQEQKDKEIESLKAEIEKLKSNKNK